MARLQLVVEIREDGEGRRQGGHGAERHQEAARCRASHRRRRRNRKSRRSEEERGGTEEHGSVSASFSFGVGVLGAAQQHRVALNRTDLECKLRCGGCRGTARHVNERNTARGKERARKRSVDDPVARSHRIDPWRGQSRNQSRSCPPKTDSGCALRTRTEQPTEWASGTRGDAGELRQKDEICLRGRQRHSGSNRCLLWCS